MTKAVLIQYAKMVSIAFAFNFTAMNTSAQTAVRYLSAKDSDPIKMGWMQGFPPSKDKLITVADGTAFQFPQIRWSVVNVQQLLPTAEVSRGLSAPSTLPYQLDKFIDKITFMPWGEKELMTWEASLWKNYTDGMLILHKGKIVYERYFGALTESKIHLVMSLTKSFTGTLASILVSEALLDENKLVSEYVPELKQSAFADATLRQVMDMTTALQFSEDYADANAEIWAFSAAGNPLPKPDRKSVV